jgi:hypothetical protein
VKLRPALSQPRGRLSFFSAHFDKSAPWAGHRHCPRCPGPAPPVSIAAQPSQVKANGMAQKSCPNLHFQPLIPLQNLKHLHQCVAFKHHLDDEQSINARPEFPKEQLSATMAPQVSLPRPQLYQRKGWIMAGTV